MTDKTGGPAFPAQWFDKRTDDIAFAQGMTLRDYFAAKAMQGFADKLFSNYTYKEMADRAYGIADAMLKAREQ